MNGTEKIPYKECDGKISFLNSFPLRKHYDGIQKMSTTGHNMLSQTSQSTNKNHLLLSATESSNYYDNIKNICTTESNFKLPLIIVPPKEKVAHIDVESEQFDLPIIIEPETDNYQSAIVNHHENDSFHPYSIPTEENVDSLITSPDNKSKNYGIMGIDYTETSPKLHQSFPIEKKINVLSQYVFQPDDTKPIFYTETNSESGKVIEANNNNDITNRNEACELASPVYISKESNTNSPIRSDSDHLGFREDPYEFQNEDSEDIEYEERNAFFNESSDESVNAEAETSENNVESWDKIQVRSSKINVTTKSAEQNTGGSEEEVERTNKKHYKDKQTFCYFCEKDVSHFSRHLSTWHQNEIEVQRLDSYKSNSKERRQALRVIAKRGNYVKNRSTLQLRPVRRLQSGILTSNSDFLPCPHCLGFYKRKTLYRHTKTCDNKPLSTQKGNRQKSRSEGQTALLLGKFKHDELLLKELFPRMRADEVTLTAKNDPLICRYAYSYMKGRKSKGNLDFVRTSVRNLAKLLQLSKESDGEIKGLIDLLRPKLFTKIINNVNIIGGYNEKDDSYESPTVAMNFGTLLKKCCDLAIIQLLQESDTEAIRKEIKILKTLIDSQWANEVSARASSNLNSKKWNKEELLPLTSDLKKLSNYLERNVEDFYEQLKKNEKDGSAYSSLKEVLYCRIILMNRRRPAEVAQIKLETYKSIHMSVQETEFDGCLTETEKILLKTCSRLVIRGKRGRGVPVLLSQDMKKQFDFLVKVRKNFIENNDFIFHTTGQNFLDGTKVLYKYANKCGIQNPKSISATRLRKHLATVTQLLQFSESDLEQLSRFMGHTLQTHCNFYRLSDSTYQTAKISKLLLLATEGGLEKYKGMDLNDIDIDLNPISDNRVEEDIITEQIPDDLVNTSNDNLTEYVNSGHLKKTKCTTVKQAWSSEQKQIIAKYFAEHIKKKMAPKQSEVTIFQEEYPSMFKDRKWTTIKAVVYNFYTGELIIPID